MCLYLCFHPLLHSLIQNTSTINDMSIRVKLKSQMPIVAQIIRLCRKILAVGSRSSETSSNNKKMWLIGLSGAIIKFPPRLYYLYFLWLALHFRMHKLCYFWSIILLLSWSHCILTSYFYQTFRYVKPWTMLLSNQPSLSIHDYDFASGATIPCIRM